MNVIKRKRYVDGEGEVTVLLRPLSVGCGAKEAVAVQIKHGRRTLWAPAAPLCLAPSIDTSTRKGKNRAADDAVAFFENRRSR